MRRIERAFTRRFLELLSEIGARQRDKGIHWIFSHARTHGSGDESRALAEQNIVLAEKVRRFKIRTGRVQQIAPPVLFCDAGLGGLARWLRASGWDTRWVQDVKDETLVREAEQSGGVVVTTDSFLLDRRPIVQGKVRAIWVPPTLTRFEQLRLVAAELGASSGDSRCMRCGGPLIRVEKEAVKERIPPKTYRWVDEYFECDRCHQLFWQGTHWQRVSRQLTNMLPVGSDFAGGSAPHFTQ